MRRRSRPVLRLVEGRTYDLVLNASSGPTFRTRAILSAASADLEVHRMESYAFREGVGQYSTNGGSSWSPMYGGYRRIP